MQHMAAVNIRRGRVFYGWWIVGAAMEPMAGRAGELSSGVAGGLAHSVVLATDDRDLAVGPEAVFEEVGLVLGHEGHRGELLALSWAKDVE